MALTTAEYGKLYAALELLQSMLGDPKNMQADATPRGPAPAADDADLDGKFGDPVVRFKPNRWTGADFKGCNFSCCSPEFLDQLAESFDYFAKRADDNGETTSSGKPKAPYNHKDAARARGWAKRIRSGWRPPTFAEPSPDPETAFTTSEFPPVGGLTDDDIPFAWLLPLIGALALAGRIWA